MLVGPHTPDLARPLSEVAAAGTKERLPRRDQRGLIGTLHQLLLRGHRPRGRRRRQARRPRPQGEGVAADHARVRDRSAPPSSATASWPTLEKVGATVLANACGPCIGQWKRDDVKQGRAEHHRHLLQPQLPRPQRRQPGDPGLHREPRDRHRPGLAGRCFNPLTDTLGTGRPASSGWSSHRPGAEAAGRAASSPARRVPGARPRTARKVEVTVDAGQPSACSCWRPSPPGTAGHSRRMPRAAEGQGQVHHRPHLARPAPGCAIRGHLDNISDNMFIGAINAFTGRARQRRRTCSPANRANPRRRWRATTRRHGRGWIVVGDENYGEGSSREHAAMEPALPRRRGGHRRELRAHPRDEPEEAGHAAADLRGPRRLDQGPRGRRISVPGALDFAPGKNLDVVLHHRTARGDDRGEAIVQRRADRLDPRRRRAQPAAPVAGPGGAAIRQRETPARPAFVSRAC